MATQRINAPYGDIVAVTTPYLDRAAQQLYQEQKIRQVRQQQENAALDASIQKEIGKVRAVDTPEVIKSWQDYKGLKQQLLFNKDLQKDPLAYNQLQQAAQRAYQNVFSASNKSQELKELQKNLVSEAMRNPNGMADDYGKRIATLMNTPLSAVGNHPEYGDLTNFDDYRYKGMSTDFGKMIKEAVGTPRKIAGKEVLVDDGLQFKTPMHEYGNTPGQVKDYLLGAMAMRQSGRDAAYQWDHLPEEEIASTIKKYQSLPKEYWEKIGLQEPQELLPKNPDSKAENFASYQAMKYAIDNAPREVAPAFRQNLKAIEDLKFNRQKQMQAIKQADAKDLIALRKKLNPNDAELNDSWVDNYWSKRIDEARQGQPTTFQDPNNPLTIKGAHEIQLDGVVAKSLSRNGQEPDRLFVTLDDKVLPIFYKYQEEHDKSGKKIGVSVAKDESGNPVIDEDFSKPISLDQAYLALGYKGQTKKQLSGTMKGATKTESHPLPAGKPRVVKQGGYTYTWNEKTGQYE